MAACTGAPAMPYAFPMLGWLNRLVQGAARPLGDTLGGRGEDAAARFLRKSGFRVLCRNYRCDLGEIDIIARDGKTLVFVEVKTRVRRARAEEQVNAHKGHQLTRAARHFLSRYGATPPAARFDVIGIVWPAGRDPQIRHTPHAFEATF